MLYISIFTFVSFVGDAVFKRQCILMHADRSRNDWGKGKALAPTMITTANAPVCPPETRELPGPRSGFGAHINRHPAGSEIKSGTFFLVLG